MPQSHTWQGVDLKILSIRKEPTLSGFLSLNAQSILPHVGTGGSSQVSWFRLPVAAGLFTFLYFRLLISKFQHEVRCSQYENVSCQTNEDTNYLNLLVRTLASHWNKENLDVLRTVHTQWLPGERPRHFSPTCAVHIEDCGG